MLNASARAVRIRLDQEWSLGGVGVKGDAANDRRFGHFRAVLLVLDGRVEHIPQEGQAESEQQTDHHAH
jgi:hypothetical protein